MLTLDWRKLSSLGPHKSICQNRYDVYKCMFQVFQGWILMAIEQGVRKTVQWQYALMWCDMYKQINISSEVVKIPQWMKLYPFNWMKLVHPFCWIYFLCFASSLSKIKLFGNWSWTRHSCSHSFHWNDNIPASVDSERLCINRGPLLSVCHPCCLEMLYRLDMVHVTADDFSRARNKTSSRWCLSRSTTW